MVLVLRVIIIIYRSSKRQTISPEETLKQEVHP